MELDCACKNNVLLTLHILSFVLSTPPQILINKSTKNNIFIDNSLNYQEIVLLWKLPIPQII